MKSKYDMKHSKKMHNVTILPGWILKLKGKFDSQKGKGVCDEYIQRLTGRVAAMEADEIIDAEKALHNARKEAAVILTGFSDKKEVLSKIPDNRKEETVFDIRNNRRNRKCRGDAQKSLKAAVEKLTEINEQIIDMDIVLDERIHKIRNHAGEKIHAYIIGIRCGSLSDYIYDLSDIDDSARMIYIEKHKSLDRRIREVIGDRMQEDTEEVVA